MDLHVTLTGRGRLRADVYAQLKQAILDGRLRPGDPVPPTRELAARLAVSRNTVLGAYERLIAEGFLAGRVGSGTFVATEVGALPRRRAPRGAALQPRPLWRELARGSPPRAPAAAYDFQIGAPDPGLFPWDAWRRITARQLRAGRRDRGYPPPEGEPALRAAIARHVGVARSVHAGADDVLVTGGAQQAIDLIGRVLIEPGACVAVEDPGYPPARHAFEAAGADVVPVPVDDEGLVVDALPARARVVYVTPSHQFPLGTAMSLARRLSLLAWAERHDAAIVEDDYDSELRFGGRPLEPLQSLDRRGRVLYVGTFSKVLLPTLRVGFVVAPPSLMPALHAAKQLADSHGAPATQRALAELLDDGTLGRHVRLLARVYSGRRDALLAAVARHLGDVADLVPSSAGLHVALTFRDPRLDASKVARRALAGGVSVQPLTRYYQARPRAGLALGYGVIPEGRIAAGVQRLAAALER